MKRILNLLVVASGLLAVTTAFFAPVVYAAKKPKVDVCHIPPGNPSNYHTININENAVPAHLGHGDILGDCASITPEICDDQNFCTVEAFVPGTLMCLAVEDRDSVDCSDGDPATTDSCDATNGCINTPIPADIFCDDNNVCTIDEYVDPGASPLMCTNANEISCDDGDPATTDSCDATNGCENTPIPADIFCDDSNACTIDEYVDLGASPLMCTNANPTNCDDGDPNTRDSCDVSAGCINVPIDDPVPVPDVSAQSQGVTTDGNNVLSITLEGNAVGISSGESLSFSTTQGSVGFVSAPTPIVPASIDICSVSKNLCTDNNDCADPLTETCDAVIPPITSATVDYAPVTADTADTFDFTVDFGLGSASATVTITPPEGAGTPPDVTAIEAEDDAVEALVGGSVAITLNAIAPSSVGDLTFTTSNGPTDGTLGTVVHSTVLPVRSASVTYTHTGTAPAADAFDFAACDSANPTVCDTATVNITINAHSDLATDKTLEGDINQPLPFTIP